jgi:hypothetical protein
MVILGLIEKSDHISYGVILMFALWSTCKVREPKLIKQKCMCHDLGFLISMWTHFIVDEGALVKPTPLYVEDQFIVIWFLPSVFGLWIREVYVNSSIVNEGLLVKSVPYKVEGRFNLIQHH